MIRYYIIQRCILSYHTRSEYKNIIQDHDIISFDTILYDTRSYDTILNEMTHYQLIEYHMIQYRMIQYNIIFFNKVFHHIIKLIICFNIIGIVLYIITQQSHLSSTFK